MAIIDDELVFDDKREIAFIREELPLDAKEHFSDDMLQWMLDAIAEHYYDEGIFDRDEDEIDIDMSVVAEHLCKRYAQEKGQELDPQEVFFVVQADLDFMENEC